MSCEKMTHSKTKMLLLLLAWTILVAPGATSSTSSIASASSGSMLAPSTAPNENDSKDELQSLGSYGEYGNSAASSMYGENDAEYELRNPESYIASRKIENGPPPTGCLHAVVLFGLESFIDTCLSQADTDVNEADARGNTALHLALIDNKPHVNVYIGKLLHHGAAVNVVNEEGYSPLDEAIFSKTSKDVVNELLLSGADANDREQGDGWSPLHIAVYCENIEATETLLQVSSVRQNIDERNLDEHTALHLATLGKNTPLAKMLLDAGGADANEVDGHGRTPLHLAVAGRNIEITDLLLETGGLESTNTRDNEGNTPLHLAVAVNETMVQLLCERNPATIDAFNDDGRTPLLMVNLLEAPLSVAAPLPFMVTLLACGADVDKADFDGETVFHKAARLGDAGVLALVQGLVAESTAFDWPTLHGITPLYLAMKRSHGAHTLDFVTALLEEGASLTRVDDHGNTLLHAAAGGGNDDMLDILLAAPQSSGIFNDQSHSGATPLHLAAEHADDLCIEALLNAHADPNIRDNEGRTALHYVAQSASLYSDVVTQQLLDAGANPNVDDYGHLRPLHLVARQVAGAWSAPVIALLLGAGANPNAPSDFRGQTPLHMAVTHQSPFTHACVHLLLFEGAGANLGALDSRGQTALHVAAMQDSPQSHTIIQMLHAWGANVDLQNNRGRTPLFLAARKLLPQNVQALLNTGANPNIGDEDGDTPFHALLRRQDQFALPLEGNHKAVFNMLAAVTDQALTNEDGDTAFEVFRQATSPP